MIRFILVFGAILFALMALRAQRLITAALWLAGTSALVSILMYIMGAHQAAVIELSVGAGLVTVLFVFAVSISGEEQGSLKSIIPWWLGSGLVILVTALLAWMVIPSIELIMSGGSTEIAAKLWSGRGLDILVQVVLIFAGVLGLLGLLAEAKAPLDYPLAEAVAAQRDRELEVLAQESVEREAR